jgi:hypothetical protein
MAARKIDAPVLKRVTMTCDFPLSEKLEAWPAVDVCFNRFSTTVFVGGMGSGKTTLCLSLLTGPLKKLFTFIYVVCPATSMASIKDSPLKCLPDEQFFDDLTPDVAAQLLEMVTENSSHSRRSLILIDDCQRQLKDPDVLKSIMHIIANQRHLKCSTMLLCQNYISCSPRIRAIANNILVFSVSKKQLLTLREEHMNISVAQWEAITKVSYQKPHTFLLYNGPSMRLFRNLDEEIDILSL